MAPKCLFFVQCGIRTVKSGSGLGGRPRSTLLVLLHAFESLFKLGDEWSLA